MIATREIPLSQGLAALVDADDYDWLTDGPSWSADRKDKTFYAHRNIRRPGGKRTTELMHRLILPGVRLVDHIDRNGLNNTRANLRPATDTESAQNRGRRVDNTSGFKGVSWNKERGAWCAYIKLDGAKKHLGYFADPVRAACAYDEMAMRFFGEFAVPNFPLDGAAA